MISLKGRNALSNQKFSEMRFIMNSFLKWRNRFGQNVEKVKILSSEKAASKKIKFYMIVVISKKIFQNHLPKSFIQNHFMVSELFFAIAFRSNE